MADDVKLPETKPYRVVIAAAVYDSPRLDYDIEGKGRVIFVREFGLRASEIDLVAREAKRLADLDAVVPASEPRAYGEMDDDELAKLASERGLTVLSSGADPDKPLRVDFLNSLDTFERGEVVAVGASTVPGGVSVGSGTASVTAGQPQQVGEEPDVGFDAASASVEQIADYIESENLTAPETVALAQDDPALADKVLAAEKSARGGDQRATVVSGLEKISG